MQIDGIIIENDLQTVLDRLVADLRTNRIGYIRKMTPTSTHIQICCPYHNDGLENNPSMGVRKSDGLCHCFACHVVVSLPEMVSYCFGKDDKGAFGKNWLLQNFVSISIEKREKIQLNYRRQPITQKPKIEYVSEEELAKYRVPHPYWEKRKITNPELIKLFDLGYDKEADCITMPVRDIKGNCLFVARRSVKTKYFNYPKGVEKPVYGLYELLLLIQQGVVITEIIICESIIDGLTCWEYGKYGVALNGLGTDRQFQELNMFPCRKYIIATDADNAGMKARTRIRRGLKNKIVTEFLWDVNVAKDINDMSKEMFENLEEVF